MKSNAPIMVRGMDLGTSFVNALIKEARKRGIPDEDFYDAVKDGSPFIPRFVDLIAEAKQKDESGEFLKLISGDESFVLDPTDGTEILADAKDVFTRIDSDFKNYGADERGQATKETSVQIYEMNKSGTFSQLFCSLSSDVRRLCFTQAQIIGFARRYYMMLRQEGHGNFFLFESNKQFFVAGVYANLDVFGVDVYLFGEPGVWNAEIRRRVVVPQLA